MHMHFILASTTILYYEEDVMLPMWTEVGIASVVDLYNATNQATD